MPTAAPEPGNARAAPVPTGGTVPERALNAVALGAIRAYRLLVSPMLGPRCRYLPTCSAYAVEALERHGPWRGSMLALRRVLRCHPWGGSGCDPVPD